MDKQSSDRPNRQRVEATPAEPARTSRLGRLFGRGGPPTTKAATPAGPSPVAEIDDASFLASTAGGWTIVDFWAPWCGPCRSFHPIFDAAARDHAREGLRFGRLDVDTNPKSAALLGVQSIPTLVLFDPKGNEARRIVGVPSGAAFKELILQAK